MTECNGMWKQLKLSKNGMKIKPTVKSPKNLVLLCTIRYWKNQKWFQIYLTLMTLTMPENSLLQSVKADIWQCISNKFVANWMTRWFITRSTWRNAQRLSRTASNATNSPLFVYSFSSLVEQVIYDHEHLIIIECPLIWFISIPGLIKEIHSAPLAP